MSSRGTILLLTDHAYLPDRVGGRESSIHDLALRLLSVGWRPVVVSALGRWPDRIIRVMRAAKLGYPVVRTADPIRAVAALKKEFGDPIVVANISNAAVKSMLDGPAALKLVLYFRDLEDVDCLSGDRLGGCTHLVANSDFVASRILQQTGLRPLMVPPLIDPNRYRAVLSKRFVTFVNPCGLKGLPVARRLAEMLPDMDFLFVESWRLGKTDWRRLRESVFHLANVRLLRRQSDMRPVYAGTRVLLAPSQWEEGWGRVVTEAQFSGIPALASRIGGLPESVGSGGVLVEATAPIEDWADALVNLYASPGWDFMSKAALQQAQTYLMSAEKAFHAFNDLLNRMSVQTEPVHQQRMSLSS